MDFATQSTFLFCCFETQTQSYVRSCCCCRSNELGCRKSKRDFEKLKENPLAYVEKESINLQIWYFIESQPLQNNIFTNCQWTNQMGPMSKALMTT